MSFEYPKAGLKSPPEVKAAINRFDELPAAKRSKKPLLWWLLGSSTQDFKMAKTDADYTKDVEGPQTCANCQFAYYSLWGKRYICSNVHGPIHTHDWCRLWEG